jgi:hypothetical protein
MRVAAYEVDCHTVHAAMREVLAVRAGTELADLIASGAIRVPTRRELRDWDVDRT